MSASDSRALRVVPAPAPISARRTQELPRLVRAAARGNDAAWNQLVRRTSPIVGRTVARMTLAPADVDDVVQTAWLRAFTQLHTLRDPEAFPGWIAMTARREALRVLQRRTRELLVDDIAHLEEPGEAGSDPASEHQRRDAVHAAVGRLPAHERRLIERMLEHPGANYADIARQLAIPIGSIGPTRQRAFARLRRDEQFVAVTAD